MGQAFSEEFNVSRERYSAIIGRIREDSVERIYSRITETNQFNSDQLNALSQVIIEKVFEEKSSLKLAELVKRLEYEVCEEDKTLYPFKVHFYELMKITFSNFVGEPVDHKCRDRCDTVRSIASFVGHLFVVHALDLEQFVEILQKFNAQMLAILPNFNKLVMKIVKLKLKDLGYDVQQFCDIVDKKVPLKISPPPNVAKLDFMLDIVNHLKDAKYSKTFTCKNTSHCHPAAAVSVTMLSEHINHKFFTPERIDICTKLTKDMLRKTSSTNLVPTMHFVEEYYRSALEFHLKDCKTDSEHEYFIKFSYAIASFYNENLASATLMCKWLDMVYEVIEKIPVLSENGMAKLYKDIFKKVSPHLRSQNEAEYNKHVKNINKMQVKKTFAPNEKFGILIQKLNESNLRQTARECANLNLSDDDETIEFIVNTIVDVSIKDQKSAMLIAIYNAIVEKKDKVKFRTVMQKRLESEIDRVLHMNLSAAREATGKEIITIVVSLAEGKLITRLGIASLYRHILNYKRSYTHGGFNLMIEMIHNTVDFLLGSKPFPKSTEKILTEVREGMNVFTEMIPVGNFKTFCVETLKQLENVLNQHKIVDMEQKKKEEEQKKESEKKNSEKTIVPSALADESELDTIDSYKAFCAYFDSHPFKSIRQDEKIFSTKVLGSLKINSKEEYEDLAEKVLSRVFHPQYSLYLSVLAQMALRINSSVQCQGLNNMFSFKMFILDGCVKRFKNLTNEVHKRTAAAFFGELYNIDWISKNVMHSFINDLKANVYTEGDENGHIIVLQSLLKVCGCKLAKQGSKDQLVEYRSSLKKSLKSNDNHVKYIAQDAVNSLNNIIHLLETAEKLSKKEEHVDEVSKDPLTIDNLFGSMSEEAYNMIVTEIKKDPVKTTHELNSIAEKIIQKSIAASAYIFAKAANDLKDLSCENNLKFPEVLSNKCYDIFQEFLRDENKSSNLLKLMQFIGDLYNIDILTNDFINPCFEHLFNTSPKISIACIDVLTRTCGKKMELANDKKLEFYFKYFEHIAATENTYRAKVFSKLVNLRQSDWIAQDMLFSYEDLLIQYSVGSATAADVSQKLKTSEEMHKFVITLWAKILREPHPSYSELCHQIANAVPEFTDQLSTFLAIRCSTFANLEPDYWTETVMNRFAQVVTFVSELYAKNILSDGLLEMWIDAKIADKISTPFLDSIAYNVSSNVDKSESKHLKILLCNLNDVKDIRAKNEVNSIQNGFCKLTSMIKDLQGQKQ